MILDKHVSLKLVS